MCDKHPVPEVRQNAFRKQHILPTPPGDAQQNPPDSEASIVIKAYGLREEEELPKIAQLAHLYTQRRPHHTVAILVPTNDTGHKLSEHLDSLEAHYDNQLRGGQREGGNCGRAPRLAGSTGQPHRQKCLRRGTQGVGRFGNILRPPMCPRGQSGRFQALLQSIYRPELLLFPEDAEDFLAALPPGVLRPEELPYLTQFIYFLQRLFPLRLLPIDDLVIALSDELFATARDQINETDLAIAYQIANVLRRWYDMEPDWRLPQLAGQRGNHARPSPIGRFGGDEDGH